MDNTTPKPTPGSPGADSPESPELRYLHQQVTEQAAELERVRQALHVCEGLRLQSEQNAAERASLLVRERELGEFKSNFVTLASHEFRTPIGTILMSASLIGRYTGDGEAGKRERHVQRIKSAVNDLTRLLNEFMALSQLEQQIQPNQPKTFALPGLCHEVIEEMQALLKPGQVIAYSHGTGDSVITFDDVMLKNILVNLVGNASKYSAEHKPIGLTTAVRRRELEIEVSDQGIGIPDTDKNRLFINFFRARNAIHIQGTGLGLYLVKRYVDLLGGTITFTSRLNVGTVFTVTLPLTSQAHENHSTH